MDYFLSFVMQAQLTKALSFSCCVEVYQLWSNQSLVEVAAQCLTTSPHESESHHQSQSILASFFYHFVLFPCCTKTYPFPFSFYLVEREGSEASLSVAMAGIHQSACQYASVLLRTQPFSPQTYMEFIAHFGYLSHHLHKQQQSQANRQLCRIVFFFLLVSPVFNVLLCIYQYLVFFLLELALSDKLTLNCTILTINKNTAVLQTTS